MPVFNSGISVFIQTNEFRSGYPLSPIFIGAGRLPLGNGIKKEKGFGF